MGRSWTPSIGVREASSRYICSSAACLCDSGWHKLDPQRAERSPGQAIRIRNASARSTVVWVFSSVVDVAGKNTRWNSHMCNCQPTMAKGDGKVRKSVSLRRARKGRRWFIQDWRGPRADEIGCVNPTPAWNDLCRRHNRGSTMLLLMARVTLRIKPGLKMAIQIDVDGGVARNSEILLFLQQVGGWMFSRSLGI